jgi:ABC-type glycerol-3-phosphate transport system substrate-binding protein
MASALLRRYERSMIAKSLRTLAACMLLALSACAGGNSSADLAPAAAPQQTPAATAAPPPAPKEPLTPEKAKADCWMKYEGDKKIKNIDQRLALVEKCVDETTRNQLVQRPQR